MASTKISLKKSDLSEGKPVRVDVNGKKIMLTMLEGKLYAIEADCSHRGGPLEKGQIDGHTVTCPWHGAKYDIRTGAGDSDTPWGPGQHSFNVKVEGNDIIIDA